MRFQDKLKSKILSSKKTYIILYIIKFWIRIRYESIEKNIIKLNFVRNFGIFRLTLYELFLKNHLTNLSINDKKITQVHYVKNIINHLDLNAIEQKLNNNNALTPFVIPANLETFELKSYMDLVKSDLAIFQEYKIPLANKVYDYKLIFFNKKSNKHKFFKDTERYFKFLDKLIILFKDLSVINNNLTSKRLSPVNSKFTNLCNLIRDYSSIAKKINLQRNFRSHKNILIFVPSTRSNTEGGTKTISRICKYLSQNDFGIFIFLTGDFTKEKDFNYMHENYDFGSSKYLSSDILRNLDEFSVVLTDRNTPKYFHDDFQKLTNKQPINIFYLLQDYEPLFSEINSYSALIYSSYAKNYKYITAGIWLRNLLIKLHNIDPKNICSFNLGVDYKTYKKYDDIESELFKYIKNPKNSNENLKNVFRSWICLKKKIALIPIYGRAETQRRAVELAVVGIEKFLENYSIGVEVNVPLFIFFGSDSSYIENLPSLEKYSVDIGKLKEKELSLLFNISKFGMAFSLTNYNLITAEMNACGLKALEIKVPSTEHLSENKLIERVSPDPFALAESLNNNLINSTKSIKSEFHESIHSWESSLENILSFIKENCL